MVKIDEDFELFEQIYSSKISTNQFLPIVQFASQTLSRKFQPLNHRWNTSKLVPPLIHNWGMSCLNRFLLSIPNVAGSLKYCIIFYILHSIGPSHWNNKEFLIVTGFSRMQKKSSCLYQTMKKKLISIFFFITFQFDSGKKKSSPIPITTFSYKNT